jgi:hypothetical protein
MLISVIFFLCVSLAIISGLVSPAVREFKNASVNLNSKQSYFLAESGSEDAFYRILKNIPISNSAILKLNKNSVTTTVTSLSGNSKQISSLGNVSNLQRKTNVVVSTDTGVSFNYGIQVGQGGVNLIGSGKVNGNIYADGPITGDSSAIITGTAISAGSGGKIIGSSGSQYNQLHVGTVSGTAQAHTVNYTNATGNIYCTLGTGNNKSCISQADPANVDFPVSDTDIAEWEADALTGGISNGNYSVGWAGATLGPKKIVGNLTVSGGGTLTVSGTLWVTGNIYLSGGGTIQLVSGYGASDGVIIADGTITIDSGGHATSSGTSGSYLMMLSNNNGNNAVSISGGAGAVIVYAPYGTINITGGASLKEVTGYKVSIAGGSSVTYESGLANNSFSSGPSGSWAIQTWGESQ